jgi:hypothetical protein
MKMLRLSALRTGRLYPPEIIPSTHSCWRLSQPQGHSAAGRIMSMKIPVTQSEIEPAAFRLVAQCLNQRFTLCGLSILHIVYVCCMLVCQKNRDWIKRFTHTHTHILYWTFVLRLYTYWIHIKCCTNVSHTPTPSCTGYCRWNAHLFP